MRYGDRRNLSFVLPKEGNYLGHPKLFSKTLLPVELVPAFGFNVLAHHTRFDASAIKVIKLNNKTLQLCRNKQNSNNKCQSTMKVDRIDWNRENNKKAELTFSIR